MHFRNSSYGAQQENPTRHIDIIFNVLFLVKGSPEVLPAAMYDGELSHESVNKVLLLLTAPRATRSFLNCFQISAQLLNALSELEALQEGNQQLKMAEKRRNKFEFIRFGRK